MNPQALIEALRLLDALYQQKSSFSTWLAGNTQLNNDYEQVKKDIEAAFPGLRIVYVDVVFKVTHALIAED